VSFPLPWQVPEGSSRADGLRVLGDEKAIIVIDGEIVVERKAEDVFRFVAEGYFEHLGLWNKTLLSIRKTSEGPVAKGTSGVKEQKLRGDVRLRAFEVVEFESPTLFAVQNTPSDLERHYLGRYRFLPLENGATRVERHLELDWNVLAFRLFPFLARRWAQRDLDDGLRRLKAAVETAIPLSAPPA